MLLSNKDIRTLQKRLLWSAAVSVGLSWLALLLLDMPNMTTNTALVLRALAIATCLFPGYKLLLHEPLTRLSADMDLSDFDTQLNRALETEDDEQGVFHRVGMALRKTLQDDKVEVLLGDSGGGGLRPVVEAATSPICDVKDAARCLAVRRNHTQRFASSEALDVCPRLVGRAPCSAVCVPVSVGGRAVGVIHAVGAPGVLPSEPAIAQLERVALRTGPRLGALRVIKSNQHAASVDPLTGLLNRRSFAEKISDLIQDGHSFALAMADLDHFKSLNDKHGHEVGDRALKAFAEAVRSVVRGGDVVARFGGEEFVLVLPDLSAEDAAGVLERIQRALPVGIARAKCPGFTVSFGVADSDASENLDDLISIADAALYQAKQAGRNRVMVATQPIQEVHAG